MSSPPEKVPTREDILADALAVRFRYLLSLHREGDQALPDRESGQGRYWDYYAELWDRIIEDGESLHLAKEEVKKALARSKRYRGWTAAQLEQEYIVKRQLLERGL